MTRPDLQTNLMSWKRTRHRQIYILQKYYFITLSWIRILCRKVLCITSGWISLQTQVR